MNNDKCENKNGEMDQEDIREEREAYVDKNEEDIKVSEEENKKIAQQEEEAAAQQGEASQKEEEGTPKEEEGTSKEAEQASEEGQGDTVTPEQCEANYTPPYYIPNFTVANEGEAAQSGTAAKNAKKPISKSAVVVICCVTMLLALLLGTFLGIVSDKLLDLDFFKKQETVDLVRSNREIKVNEIPGSTGYENLTVAQVAALVSESVVEITTTHVQTNTIYGQYITSGAGSGVIFSQMGTTGYIVTNYHVIDSANEISVRVKDGDSYYEFKAAYVAGDAAEDIAVITITVNEGYELTTAVFGDSAKSVVGEEVVAIGNPLGKLGGTVTNGIISALDREILVGNNVMTLLQTNAAINPGNSGGGLFNMSGELIGIVNAKQSSSGIEGLGFAIPSNVVNKEIQDILELGYVSGRVTLGVEVTYGQLNGQAGVFITNAGDTEFKYADRIVKINDTVISSLSDYNAALKKLNVGDTVTVQVARSGAFKNVVLTAKENTSAR